MKKHSLFFLLFLMSFNSFSQQPTIQWKKTLGGTASDFSRNVIQTADGGYITAADVWSNDGDVTGQHGSFDYWIVKMDATGAIQWQKAFGGTGYDFAYSIQQTTDGGYVIPGWSDSNDGDVTGNHGDTDFWIVKIDATGMLQWQKSIGGSASDFAYAVSQTADGGYMVAGRTYSTDGNVTNNKGGHDYWIVKVDAIGTIQWQKTYGGSLNDFAYSIQQTTDGAYIVAGNTNSNDEDVSGNHGLDDCWIVKVDAAGIIQWQKTYGGSGDDYARYIQQTADNGYIIVGETNSNDGDIAAHHGQTDCWVVKMDATGTIEWQKTLGGSNTDIGQSIQQTADNGYIIAGWSDSNNGDVTSNQGGSDYWIIKLDYLGAVFWQQSFGGTRSDFGYSVQTTSDGGFIVSGNSNSNDGDVFGNHSTLHDIWIIKFNGLPLSVNSDYYPTGYIYPNPGLGEFNFVNIEPTSKIEIYDIAGRCLFTSIIQNSSFVMDMKDKANGVYFYKITGKNSFSGKLIKN